MVRVRFAPSPTGIPHIGSARTALFNFLLARSQKGEFILRIEDTDRARLVDGAKEAILQILEWLGLSFDKMYVQSERLDIYKEYAEKLISLGVARKEEGAIRFIVPQGKTLEWTDAVGSKKISFQSNVIENFIILKSDGYPTYHLASVIDDALMEITHVIRGEEWISSTPKHILLYKALNLKPPVFVHLPSIVAEDKKKLSKRHGAKSILDYKNEGFLAEALLNFLALLGWNPGEDREVMKVSEMVKLFSLSNLNISPSFFDQKKLEWLNGVYIRQTDDEKIFDYCQELHVMSDNLSSSQKKEIIKIAKERIIKLTDIGHFTDVFFVKPKFVLSEKEKTVKTFLEKKLLDLTVWRQDTIFAALKEVLLLEDIKMSVLYRILTGEKSGLPLAPLFEVLGKDIVVEHLKAIG